jgi:hypothetical protein
MGNVDLPQKNEVKYLGMHLDRRLTWAKHIKTKRKVNKKVKNAVFWELAPCRFCVNRRFRGMYRLHLQGRKIRERETSVSRWLQTTAAVTVVKLTTVQVTRLPL